MASQLVGSSFAEGALLPNYVNGRLLAAEDLATSQSTLLRRDTCIGQAAGPGVVNGLWVTAAATTLTVAGGLGVTPSGEPVSVPDPVTLQFSIAGTPGTSAGGSFANCTATSTGTQAAINAGAFVLTALPACQLQGQAPMAIPPGSDTPVACTAQWQVEGVQFKAIPLPIGAAVNGINVNAVNRQNLLAHWCFGTAQLAGLGVDPFTFSPAYRGLDQLTSTDLTPCDLPLCVFYWDSGAITFVDNWSVRRRTTRPDVSGVPWSVTLADQRSADGEARFLQFQDQISDLMSQGLSRKTVAADVFGLLPPVGFLPLPLDVFLGDVTSSSEVTSTTEAAPHEATVGRPISSILNLETVNEATVGRPIGILNLETINLVQAALSQSVPQSGFVPSNFFGSLARPGGVLTWDTAYFALRQSYFLEPAATGEEAEGSITYYYVIENLLAVIGAVEQNASTVPSLYVVFVNNQYWLASNTLPFTTLRSFLS